ncbi:MAG: DUF5522 domain-containing protein [Bacteroidota bacterium]
MNQPMVEEIDFYYTDEGYVVFTEKYHWARGYCCGNGCRHCPFRYDCVPEPQKAVFLKEKSWRKK